MGHPPLYVTFSICPSVSPSITHHISETIHHLIIIFGTHVYNDISSRFFHFFDIFIFWAVEGVNRWKTVQNEKYQLHLSCAISQEHEHDFWCTCVRWWYLQVFFSFFWNFHFLGWKYIAKMKYNYIYHVPYLRNSIEDKKWPKITKNSVSLSISGTVLHVIVIWYTCVEWWYF